MITEINPVIHWIELEETKSQKNDKLEYNKFNTFEIFLKIIPDKLLA